MSDKKYYIKTLCNIWYRNLPSPPLYYVLPSPGTFDIFGAPSPTSGTRYHHTIHTMRILDDTEVRSM